jgi:hypothetical protein
MRARQFLVDRRSVPCYGPLIDQGSTTVFVVACGSPEWGWSALIVLIAIVVYVLPVSLAFRTAPAGTRKRLTLLYLVAVGISVVFGFVLPGGLSGDANYLGLFFGGVAVGGATGLGAGLHRSSGGVFRSGLVGALGGGTFLAFVLGAFLFALAVTGACLD